MYNMHFCTIINRLHEAALNGRIEIVEALLSSQNVDVDVKDNNGTIAEMSYSSMSPRRQT